MKYLMSLIFLIGSLSADAKKSNVTTVELKAGSAVLRLINEDLGEPIAAPSRLTIQIKCKGQKSFKQAALYRMCELEGKHLEPDGSVLHLKMKTARVEPHSGDVICDQVDRQSLDIRKLCP